MTHSMDDLSESTLVIAFIVLALLLLVIGGEIMESANIFTIY